MYHRLQCQCGALQGQISHPHRAIHGICYCKDCRAYSRHLGVESRTHDTSGGAEFVATQAKYISFSDGIQNLACLSLSEKGLLRWYSKCCNTPVCNTPRNWKIPYVGLVHTCLKSDPAAFVSSFPQLQVLVNTGSAKQRPSGMAFKTFATLAGFIPRVIAGSITGAYKSTPFFNTKGQPITSVTVLSETERSRAYGSA